MRAPRTFVLALITGALAAVLTSCGGSSEKLIPPVNSAALRASLDQVERQATAGNCDTAAAATDQVIEQIDALPSTVDPKLKEALKSGTATLRQLAESPSACQTSKPTQTETTQTQTQTTQTQTTPTTTTETQTTETSPESGGTGAGGGTPPGGAPPGGTP